MHEHLVTLLNGEANHLGRRCMTRFQVSGVGLQGDEEVRVDEQAQASNASSCSTNVHRGIVPRADHYGGTACTDD